MTLRKLGIAVLAAAAVLSAWSQAARKSEVMVPMRDGVKLALRYRESPEKPLRARKNEPYRIRIDLWSTALEFERGHKIALHVTSSNWPRFERNANTWEPVKSYADAVVAHNRVYRDADHPSSVVLPVRK